jgi:glyoxylase-like metal-dependent hydrolase (beta-lactamase superfamily II)
VSPRAARAQALRVTEDEPVDEGPKPEELASGVARALSPMVRRIVAPNPGFMTGPGTNTYLVGIDEIAVIDPGPDEASHLDAVVGCGGDRIRWILLTHTHLDHAPAAKGLAKRTGAPVLAFAPTDDSVHVDQIIGEGFTIEATEFRLKAIHTPGHASNHLCFLLVEEQMLFSGDHINNGQTVVINPPDGDMATYLASLEKLKKVRLRTIAPGHGHLIDDPKAKIDEYLTHRRDRERQIMAAVRKARSGATVDDLVATVYGDTIIEALQPVAARSVLAHLLKLKAEKQVRGRDEKSKWKAA